jgi:hypothetical protein
MKPDVMSPIWSWKPGASSGRRIPNSLRTYVVRWNAGCATCARRGYCL